VTTPQSSDSPPLSSLELERRAFRRRQSVGSIVIGAVSTLVFAVLVWVFVVNTPGWARVQDSFFDLDTAIASFPRVFEGFLVNLRILGVAVLGVAVLATFVAFLRTLRGPVFFPLRAIATAYTDLFRGIPLIIVLFLIGYGVPGLLQQRISVELLGTIALILTYSAYVSEVIRAGIEGVHPSQRMGARALGLSHGQTLRLVVLPQAIRRQAPPLMNDFVAMQKDVGLVSILGVVDAVRGAQIETSKFADFTPYVVAAVLFVLLAIPTIRLTDWVSARLRRREQMGAVV
jgi:polar amino acid transport system permease protein